MDKPRKRPRPFTQEEFEELRYRRNVVFGDATLDRNDFERTVVTVQEYFKLKASLEENR